jgi:plasmid stability protein
MSVMIQLRNVPDDLHRQLKIRAAKEGSSLSAYLIGELEKIAAQPTLQELQARLAERTHVHLDESPAEALRAERAQR